MPAKVTINLANLDYNFNLLSAINKNSSLIPVLKANAYGHGAIALAKRLVKHSPKYLAFANLNEALLIKNANIGLDLLVLGAVSPEEAIIGLKNNITMSITSLEMVKHLQQAENSIAGKLHIKIDSGMNRAGIGHSNYPEILDEIKKLLKDKSNLKIEAIYSHLVESESSLSELNQTQYSIIKNLQSLTEKKIGYSIKLHLQNSGGLINFPKYDCDFSRIGLALYGYNPVENSNITLKPLLSWSAPIAYIRKVKAGDSVSYNRSGVARSDISVATILAGYADGIPRSASNGILKAIVKGQYIKSIGLVCMDMTMLQLADDNVRIGDHAILIGEYGNLKISARDLAKSVNTIEREILCHISDRNIKEYIN